MCDILEPFLFSQETRISAFDASEGILRIDHLNHQAQTTLSTERRQTCAAHPETRPGRRAQLDRLALIGFAGALGALSRYEVQGWVNDLLGRPTVLGTMVVNLTGAFLLGFFLTVTEDRFLVTGPWRLMIGTGFLGAYTTFSTFMYESVDRLDTGDFATAAANVLFSVAIGLIAAYAGIVAGRTV